MISTQQTAKLNLFNFLIVASGKSMIESSLLYGSSDSIERKSSMNREKIKYESQQATTFLKLSTDFIKTITNSWNKT